MTSQPAPARLTDADHYAYQKYGYLVLKHFFPAETVPHWIAECDRLSTLIEGMADTEGRRQSRKHLALGTIFDRLDPASDFSPLFNDLMRDPILLAVVAALFQTSPVPMKNKLITKPPGTYGYAIHQDHPYWERTGIPADLLLTAWVAIDDANEENGALEVFPEKHHARIPGPEHAPQDVDERLLDGTPGVLVELEAGDLFLFHSLVPHRSAPNRSSRHRRAFMITYTAEAYLEAANRFYA